MVRSLFFSKSPLQCSQHCGLAPGLLFPKSMIHIDTRLGSCPGTRLVDCTRARLAGRLGLTSGFWLDWPLARVSVCWWGAPPPYRWHGPPVPGLTSSLSSSSSVSYSTWTLASSSELVASLTISICWLEISTLKEQQEEKSLIAAVKGSPCKMYHGLFLCAVIGFGIAF